MDVPESESCISGFRRARLVCPESTELPTHQAMQLVSQYMISSAYSHPWFTVYKENHQTMDSQVKERQEQARALAAECKITESKESHGQAGKCTDKQIKVVRL